MSHLLTLMLGAAFGYGICAMMVAAKDADESTGRSGADELHKRG